MLVVCNSGEQPDVPSCDRRRSFGAHRHRGRDRRDRTRRCAEMREMYGVGESALAQVAGAAYHLLGRRTFLTTGDKESRAWTFRAGAKAPECAGVIHSDLQRGFIRAEVIRWDELLEIGSWSKAQRRRQAPRRGQGLRGRRRRRPRDPLQRVAGSTSDSSVALPNVANTVVMRCSRFAITSSAPRCLSSSLRATAHLPA